ncbi:MAG: hypothetical protein VCC99_13540 [Alphaproteobacteria bacterium]
MAISKWAVDEIPLNNRLIITEGVCATVAKPYLGFQVVKIRLADKTKILTIKPRARFDTAFQPSAPLDCLKLGIIDISCF